MSSSHCLLTLTHGDEADDDNEEEGQEFAGCDYHLYLRGPFHIDTVYQDQKHCKEILAYLYFQNNITHVFYLNATCQNVVLMLQCRA